MNVVVFAPDGRTLTTISSDDIEIKWGLTETPPRRLGTRNLDSRLVNFEALSPDRSILATRGPDSTVILRDLADPARPRRLGPPLSGHRSSVNSLAFSADGNILATGDSDGTVFLWDLTDRNQPRRLGQLPSGHRDLVNSMALDPDGNTLATAGNDGTVILWDLTDPARPRRLGQPLTHGSSVHSVAFSPDGNTLGTGGSDAAVLLWDLTGLNQLRSHAAERACSIAGRGLNDDEDEWTRYIPELAYRNTCPA